MPTIQITTFSKSTKPKTLSLPGELFDAKINSALMAQAVRVFLSNQRNPSAKTKTRSEISLTTKKWFRQKGTGRARHGAQSAPIFVGGGVAHGPKGVENYTLSLPKKMRRKALASSLTQKLQESHVQVWENLGDIKQAKEASEILKKLELSSKKVTLVLPGKVENWVRAWRNLKNVEVIYVHMLNAYKVLNGGMICFVEDSLEALSTTNKVLKSSVETEKKTTSKAAPVKKTVADKKPTSSVSKPKSAKKTVKAKK